MKLQSIALAVVNQTQDYSCCFLITYGNNILKGPVENNLGEGVNIFAELKAIKYV
jgi:hypothetical protein